MDGRGGDLFLADNYALFVGRVSDTSVHAHYMVQLALGLRGPFELRAGGRIQDCRAAVVPSQAPHSLRAAHGEVLLIYLDPTATPGAQVSARPGRAGVLTLGGAAVDGCVSDVERLWSAGAQRCNVDELVHRVVSTLAPGGAPAPDIDPRIRAVVGLLESETGGDRKVPDLAGSVGLSPDRLRHLFKEQLGIPIRSYKSWARVRHAAQLLAEGGSLTQVAHEANFADAAHLSRSFRGMFGITLTEFSRNRIRLQGRP
ncbi:MAG: helix-turn-helix domain-containing protein [Myxococcales bacterium]|nr:helix-turn-helix domain-containing protein [Myxococcales bacterium]